MNSEHGKTKYKVDNKLNRLVEFVESGLGMRDFERLHEMPRSAVSQFKSQLKQGKLGDNEITRYLLGELK